MIDPVFAAGWAVILAAMAVWEGIALRRKRQGDTLSELVWRVLRINNLFRWLAAGFLLWLLLHFVGLGRYG